VGDSRGTLRILDQNLTLLVEKKVKDNTLVYLLNPSKSHGKWNEVFVYSQGELMVYDMELKNRLFTFNVKPPYSANPFVSAPLLVPLNTKNGNHALVNSDGLYLISQSESSLIKNMVESYLLFSIIAFILFNSLFVYFIFRYPKALGFRPHHLESEADISSTIKALQAIAHKIKGAIGTAGWTIEKINRSAARDSSQLAGLLIEDAETLRQQTDNILKLVQIQKPKLQKKGLKHLLQKLVNHYRSVFDDKIEITFQMEKDIDLNFDKELFKEAMINLLDNAIDAMPAGGKLRVSVVPVASPARRTPEQVLIEVEDTGSGIDESDIPQLFTPFFTKKENKKGTGIGLTICKRIIEAHGATIAVHSRKGFGTKFAITIPVQ
jgi:signal transduction histidine kinase